MPGRSTIPGLAAQNGFATESTATVMVQSLLGGTLAATCSGGATVTITRALTGVGDDHPTHGAGQYVCYVGQVTFSGLSPDTDYYWTVTDGNSTISGSVHTLHQRTARKTWAFFMGTCEQFEIPYPPGWHGVMRALIEESEEPVLFYAHIDDNLYADTDRLWGDGGQGVDTRTGLALSSPTTDPQDTALNWDYCVNYAGWAGLLPCHGKARDPDRLWIHRNVAQWRQWGDHEIEGNHCRLPSDATDNNHGCDRVTLEPLCENLWNLFIGNGGPPKLRTGEQYWGYSVGNFLCFTAMDCNKHSDPLHGGSPGVSPSSPNLDFLGANQISDLLTFHNAQARPFNVFFTSDGISGHNEPWGAYWPTDFNSWLTLGAGTTNLGVLVNPLLNGTTGKMCVLKGDSHVLHVSRFASNGSATGLGGASYNGHYLVEVCPGTINGSPNGNTSFQFASYGHRLMYHKWSPGGTGLYRFGGVVKVIVREGEADPEMEVQLICFNGTKDAQHPHIVWRGLWKQSDTGNQFTYPDEWKRKVA